VHTIEESIYIDRPVETVWDYTHDFDKIPLWFSAIEVYELIGDEPMGKGSRIKDVMRFLGRRIESLVEVAEYEEYQHNAFRTIEAPFPLTWEWRYEPDGTGTRLSFRGESEGTAGFFGRLADPVVTKLYRREIVAAMGKLKDLLEH
jgi:ligand-binding SRPBCC domain-containing protein